MIQVSHLKKNFPVENGLLHAVNDVSFSVKKGEIFGIIGLSGAGKSTLIRLLNRLEEPTSGKILIDGLDITGLSKQDLRKERKEMGMIFQSFNLFQQKTVEKNIAYPMEISGWGKDRIKARCRELLDFVGLKDRASSYPSALSGGQKQRVAIARAMALDPKILLSDEGTSALDPQNTKAILELLKKLVSQKQTTIVLITHQMEVAKEICDRIAVMENGSIVEENTTEEIFFAPKHPVTRSFLSRLQEKDDLDYLHSKTFQGDLLKLSYRNAHAQDAIITDVAKRYDVSISILSANINTFRQGELGYVIVELRGEKEDRKKALFALQGLVDVEVLA